jgi:hypothetical protein
MWRQMPSDLRASAAKAFWADEQAALEQAEAVALISRQIKFRPKSVISLPLDKKARHLAGLPQVSDLLAARLMIAYHLEHQRPMMGAFLDLLGITHENGLISEENLPKPDEGKVKQAAKDLASKYPAEDVSLYLATLVSQDPETWESLVEVVEPSA